MSLPLTDDNGVVQTVANGAPVSWSAGLGYDANGLLCVTSTLSSTDVWINGWRRDTQGRLVVSQSSPEGQPFIYNAGWPTDKVTGAIITQQNTPAPTDPRIAGVAVGPLGGVYMTEGGSAWSPADLASLAAWYDPSDLSTMFNDSAGTTPVATPGTVADSANPVGLIQDKSGNGHHASQSTSTARPLLSARVNLFEYSEDFQSGVAASYWGEDGATVSGTNIFSETSANSDHRVNHGFGDAYGFGDALAVGSSYTISVRMKQGTIPYAKVIATGDGGLVTVNLATGVITSGTGWAIEAMPDGSYTISKSFVFSAYAVVQIGMTNAAGQEVYAGNPANNIQVISVQLELGTTATPYQRVTTDSDYDGDPAKFPYYMSFDGVDDYLSTSAFTTVPQPITYFVGVNPTTKPLVGHITDGSATGREFIIFGNSTVEVNAGTTQAAGDYFAATSQINTMVFNGALSAWNRNGGSFTTINPGTQGIDRLFIGANYLGGNTLKGNLYQLIFGAAVYGAPTILEAETWVAEKTGVTL